MTAHDSLSYEPPTGPPDTLHARSVAGAIEVAPRPGRTVRFGRSREDTNNLLVGADDLRVSRLHGELTYRTGRWWLRNTGQQLLRLPRGQMLHHSSQPAPLPAGYTPLFVKGSGYREHLVELYVTDDVRRSGAWPEAETVQPKRWYLDDDERLVLVMLGQAYLRYESDPRPLGYQQAADRFRFLRGGAGWTKPKIARKVENIRHRLAAAGDFPYPLLEAEPGGPCDNTFKHNLLRGLVESTTLVPPDLALLEDEMDEDFEE